ncbi:hypothetical protein NLI96_g1061 [Meripilus lineatus]|uniref:Uncharacterized protein n=1 Tax=Meripilus lineatus TaxID=2056292 RepID=A0AAD5VGU5_9APHY|nr:hypothetical protein NLI96_g1061 [Physisporinus lineatus]
MSTSYRLEAPRPRPAAATLAYTQLEHKVPSVPSLSSLGYTSPTSPTARSRSRNSRLGVRMTPPPSAGRAPTPSRLGRSDIDEFAELCRAWYYQQDDNAGRLMTQTLATLPPAQRAPFARLQATIRSAYHASVNARRNAEFQAHLSATNPGGSLMPHSRADPMGPLARKERYDRLDRFVRTWCTMGMPGTKPFFEGLWAVMRLQVIPEDLGGAGARRIEWEIDDAVFKESAGKDFMLEAIDVLKGVLAFEDIASSKRSPSIGSPNTDSFQKVTRVHSRSQSQPLSSDNSGPHRSHKAPIISTTQTKRSRAPSDPFLDSPALSTSFSSGGTTAQLSISASSTVDDPPSPTTPPPDGSDKFIPKNPALESLDAEEYLRTWTAPDLSNPEYLELLKVFPPFVMKNPMPRFPVVKASRRPADLEEGEEQEDERRDIRVGTGTMWLGYKSRSPGWQGNWWTRFKLWFKRIFC